MSKEAAGSPDATPPTTGSTPNESGGSPSRNNSNFKKKKKKPNAFGSSSYSGGFVGKIDKLKNHVYDVTQGINGFDVFARTTTEIADYIASNIPDAGEFRTAMDPNVLAFTTLTPPQNPIDKSDPLEMERWKTRFRKHDDRLELREKLTKRAYAIVWGQCSPTVQNRVKAQKDYATVSETDDLMKLLTMIRTSMYTGATSKDSAHALIDAMAHLHAFKQDSRMDHMTFLRTYTNLIEAVDHLGGDFGVHKTYIEKRLTELGLDPTQSDLYDRYKEKIRQEIIAKTFILKADPKRFGPRIASLQNDFVSGIDKYPKTLAKAYDMVVNYVNPNKNLGQDSQETGMSFYQEDQNHSGRGRGRGDAGRGGGGRIGGRGGRNAGRGRESARGSGHAKQAQAKSGDGDEDYNYEVDEEREIGDWHDNSTNKGANPYSPSAATRPSVARFPTSHATFNICEAEKMVLQHSVLPDRWLLLDSCSTIDMIANSQLLQDIHTVDNPIWVRCNAGRMQLTQQGFLGDYPYPVWYNPKGVANILSLNNLSNHYRVTMDTHDHSKAMTVHKRDGSTIIFQPSNKNGLYAHELDKPSSIRDMWSMLSTVAERAKQYSKRDYKRALLARRLQNTIMRPSDRKYQDNIIRELRDCPVTKADIQAANNIFGPNLGSLKGKTVRRTNVRVDGGVEGLPSEVFRIKDDITIAIDIMFVNKVPFFITISRDLKFGTVESIPNRRVSTIKNCLNKVISLYTTRGLKVTSILADHEFELLRPWFPHINTTAAGEHVPDIERYIRTVKDRTRSTYSVLPYQHLPRIVLIHLVKNAVFWLNAFSTGEGVTRTCSPRYVMTGQNVSYKKHAVLEFGAYVQTHEEHSNDMTQRTMGCISLGPTGNEQGGHWFMCLTSGKRVVRYRWTELPIPKDVIDRVSTIGRTQGMPSTLTYANRNGNEILDTLNKQMDVDTEDMTDSDDEPCDDDVSTENDVPLDDSSQDTDHHGTNPGDEEPESDDSTNNESHSERDDEESTHDDGPPSDADPGVGDSQSGDEPSADEDSEVADSEGDKVTEYEKFQAAEREGRMRAISKSHERRTKRISRSTRSDDFNYTIVDALMNQWQGNEVFVTEQMSIRAGLRMFGEKGSEAVTKELNQLIIMNVMSGCDPNTMTSTERSSALKYLMFLKEKRCGRIKGRGCADGRKQKLYKTKQETSSPTVSIEALTLTCLIDAHEGRDVATCDIPGAFMQADIDEEIYIKFDGELVNLLVKLAPEYSNYICMEKGRATIYAKLNKALYGTVQASLLFWKRLSSFLIDKHGFERNPYDYCVANKNVDGSQCTVVWYVDDLKVSHVSKGVVDNVLKAVSNEFGSVEGMKLTITRGKIHDYLGMRLDYSQPGKIIMSMTEYVDEMLKECPDDLLKGVSSSCAPSHLYNVNHSAEKLDEETAVIYHHLTAKLLYLSKRTRPDIQTPVSFLTTRVISPDVDDWKKLGRCVRYLRDTKNDTHTLECDGTGIIQWWVDASFAVHEDKKSHTGATMSMGKGSIYSVSRKQRLNTTSSTEAELVGVADVMGLILWTRRFMEAQGQVVNDNVVYQDNQSAMLLANNGRMSSSRRTRHIDIRYFFVTDQIAKKNLRIAYCPTDEMIADYLTKPLQGSKFRLFRALIMNLSHPISNALKECVGTDRVETTEGHVHQRSRTESESHADTEWITVRNKRISKKVKGRTERED